MSRIQACLVLLVLTLAGLSDRARSDDNVSVLYPGHSGIWFDPNRSGEGYVVEVISPTATTLTWFTYDEQGKQRWLVGVGEVVHSEMGGTRVEFSELYDTSGGVFGDSFDPALVVRRNVGSARLEFDSCMAGRFAYDAYGVSGSATIGRIAKTMGLDCAPLHGQPAAELGLQAGTSGSWYDPAHSGEGFQLQWSSGGDPLLTWYSYDADGRQYWMTGVGVRDASGRISFPSLIATRGARFGDAFDPGHVERFHWGRLTLDLDCATGQATYSADIPGFAPGTQALSRLTGLLGVSCPWKRPALAQLYDLQVSIIPTELVIQGRSTAVQVSSIADDGTVIGGSPIDGKFQLHRRSPASDEWETLSGRVLAGAPYQISPDAKTILVNEDEKYGTTFAPLLLKAGGAGEPLSNLIFPESSARAGSHHLSRVVGVGRPHGDVGVYPWIWSEAEGQKELARTDEIRLAYPLAVSESGDVVVGFSHSAEGGRQIKSGIRWVDAGSPVHLFDSLGARLGAATTCSADCRIVYGSGQADPADDHPFKGQVWVMLSSGVVRYLEHIKDAPERISYAPQRTSADGSMLVGNYLEPTDDGVVRISPYLWTRMTGSVPLRELAIAREEEIGKWSDIYAMDVASDASLVLLLGWESAGGASPTYFRAAVLRLQPRSAGGYSHPTENRQ